MESDQEEWGKTGFSEQPSMRPGDEAAAVRGAVIYMRGREFVLAWVARRCVTGGQVSGR